MFRITQHPSGRASEKGHLGSRTRNSLKSPTSDLTAILAKRTGPNPLGRRGARSRAPWLLFPTLPIGGTRAGESGVVDADSHQHLSDRCHGAPGYSKGRPWTRGPSAAVPHFTSLLCPARGQVLPMQPHEVPAGPSRRRYYPVKMATRLVPRKAGGSADANSLHIDG